jgi:hypothetical protein
MRSASRPCARTVYARGKWHLGRYFLRSSTSEVTRGAKENLIGQLTQDAHLEALVDNLEARRPMPPTQIRAANAR